MDRIWDRDKGIVAFIGLNPSTADEMVNDPTITRLVNYTRSWGFGGLVMLNLFAFRATKPRDLKKAADPVGPENDLYIHENIQDMAMVVGAWGNGGSWRDRGREVMAMIKNNGIDLHCLRVTKAGQPEHPLYLPQMLGPTLFSGRIS